MLTAMTEETGRLFKRFSGRGARAGGTKDGTTGSFWGAALISGPRHHLARPSAGVRPSEFDLKTLLAADRRGHLGAFLPPPPGPEQGAPSLGIYKQPGAPPPPRPRGERGGKQDKRPPRPAGRLQTKPTQHPPPPPLPPPPTPPGGRDAKDPKPPPPPPPNTTYPPPRPAPTKTTPPKPTTPAPRSGAGPLTSRHAAPPDTTPLSSPILYKARARIEPDLGQLKRIKPLAPPCHTTGPHYRSFLVPLPRIILIKSVHTA